MCTLQWQDRSDFNDLGQMSDYAKQFIRRGDAFKIGITANPERRRHGYRHDYDEMIVVFSTESSLEARLAERALIAKFDASDNIDPGGGGPLGESPYYVYIVRENKRASRTSTGIRKSSKQSSSPSGRGSEEGGLSPAMIQYLIALREQKRLEQKHREEQARRQSAELFRELCDLASVVVNAVTPHTPQYIPTWRVTRCDENGGAAWNVKAPSILSAADKLRRWRKMEHEHMRHQQSGNALYISFQTKNVAERYILTRHS